MGSVSTGDDAEGWQRPHGGRRSGIARAVKEHSQAVLWQQPGEPPVEFEQTVARLSRRQLIATGGALGAAAMMAAYSTRPSDAGASARSASDARVVIVGAGLAGVAAAYQLHKVGVRAHLYEARERLGGRCWTAHGFADGQIGEHGGEFIDSRHVHIRQLVKQLGLTLDDLYAARYGDFSPNWVRGKDFTQHQINIGMKPIQAAVTAEAKRVGVIRANGSINAAAITHPTATARAKLVDQLSMAEWLSQHVPGRVALRPGTSGSTRP